MNAIKLSVLLLCFLMAISCTNKNTRDHTVWVDPMIGTGNHGHIFPGATVPSGIVQISPDKRWEECNHYTFPESDKSNIILDIKSRDHVIEPNLEIIICE